MSDRIGKPISQRQLRVGEMIKQSLSMIFIRNEAKVPNLETNTITVTGTAQILEIFKVSGAGKVAGSKVMEGEITSASDVRIIRDGAIIYTGKVGTLFREKNQVKQVSNGQECGITVKDYMDFQKNDTIEAFSVTSTERSI